MSTIQFTFDDLTKPASQEWAESTRGQIQIAEEEAKLRKAASGSGRDFLKFEGQESKILHFPEFEEDGETLNTGKTFYKLWIQKIKKSIIHKTLEEFQQDEAYLSYLEDFEATKTDPKARPLKPQFRHYVYVIELTPNGGLPKTWDMSDTAYSEAFAEHLTREDRNLKVKKDKEGKGFIFKVAKTDELKALTSGN